MGNRVKEIAQALKTGFTHDMPKLNTKTDETAKAPSVVAEHDNGVAHTHYWTTCKAHRQKMSR